MTVASAAYRNDFNGSSSLSTYTFTFQIKDTSQLVFIETTAGVSTTKALTTDYTATQNSDITTGGTVTRVAGVLPTGTQLTVMRTVPNTQTYSFRNQTAFYPSDYEDAIDALCMQIIQLQIQVNKCLQYPPAEVPGTATATLPAASLRASKEPTFDSSGNVTVA